MKKTAKILAVVLAAAALGATAGLAGCSSGDSHVSVDSYWYEDSYAGIQNTTVGTYETLTYDIVFDEESGTNGTYKVIYDSTETNPENYFQTTFTALKFDWSDEEMTHESYRLTLADVEDMSAGDKARFALLDDSGNTVTDDDGNTVYTTSETVYMLTTTMHVTGRYIYTAGSGSEEENTVEFDNYMNTVTYFRSARNDLEPVYSRQEVMSTSPESLAPASKNNMCQTFRYDYEVFYNFACTQAKYVYTEYELDESGNETALEPEEHTVRGLSGTDYTLFDNNSLYTAVRGMSLSSDFSATVSLFTPANNGIMNCSVSGGSGGELDPETDADMIAALTAAYGQPDTMPAADETEEGRSYINYNSVSITRTGDMHGGSQTAWFAAVEDEDSNQYRATMLYLSIPLSFGLGNVEYRLSQVNSVLGEANQGN